MIKIYSEQKKLIKKNHLNQVKGNKKNIPITGRSINLYYNQLFPDIKINKNFINYVKNRNFLDIGCGINYLYKKSLLYKNSLISKKKSIGIDIIEIGKNNKNFKKMSIFNLKFKKNTFDLITSNNFLYFWIDNSDKLIESFIQLNKILKKNGEIGIYPVFFGNYYYNNKKLRKYLNNNFFIKILKPKKKIIEKNYYLKNNKFTESHKEISIIEYENNIRLDSHTLILKKI